MASIGILGGCVLILLAGQCAAQSRLYKCVTDGKVSYGDTPCARGVASMLSVPAAPPHDGAALARQQATLAGLERARSQREAEQARADERAARSARAQRKTCAALGLRHQWALEDAAAAGPAQRDRARRTLRRAAQRLALACPP